METIKIILAIIGTVCIMGVIIFAVSLLFVVMTGGLDDDEMMTQESYEKDNDDSISWGDIRP